MRQLSGTIDSNFVDARLTGANTGAPLAGDYSDEDALDTQLAAADAVYYTAARLGTMTINDKVFALRSAVDSAGFKPGGVIVSPALAEASPLPANAAPAAKKK